MPGPDSIAIASAVIDSDFHSHVQSHAAAVGYSIDSADFHSECCSDVIAHAAADECADPGAKRSSFATALGRSDAAAVR